ncbi:DUF6221 family protein [Streptomyces sp. NPDC054956]
MDDLVQFLHACFDADERSAKRMAEFYPTPWDVADRGWMAHVMADGPDFREVVHLEQWAGMPDGKGTPDLGEMIEHVARHNPARVLVEVDAKRRILLLHNIPAVVSPKMAAFGLRDGEAPEDDRRCAGCGLYGDDEPIVPDVSECPILRALALPYADHPDYLPEWAPDQA